jgi:heme A synthase
LGVAWTLLFPLDEGGKSETLTGMLHLAVGGLVVPLTFAFELAFWRTARKDERWKNYSVFSLVIFIITLVFGLTTVVFVNSDVRGLFERITIDSTLLWVEVLALRLYSLSRKNAPLHLLEGK